MSYYCIIDDQSILQNPQKLAEVGVKLNYINIELKENTFLIDYLDNIIYILNNLGYDPTLYHLIIEKYKDVQIFFIVKIGDNPENRIFTIMREDDYLYLML